MKKIFFMVLFVMSTGCVVVIPPPVTSSMAVAAEPQRINPLKQRVDVQVTNNCDIIITAGIGEKVYARLGAGQTWPVSLQRGITTGEPKGTITVKAYSLSGQYLGVTTQDYYYPNTDNSWVVKKEALVISELYYPYGWLGGCHHRQ